MTKNVYAGVNNVAKKAKNIYVGVNGVARKVKAAYVGVNGVARKVWPSSLIPTEYQAVEYIQSYSGFDPQGYIETGYRPNTYTRMVAKYSDHGPIGQSSQIAALSYLQEKQSSGTAEYYHFGFGSNVPSYPGSGHIAYLSPAFYFGPNNNSTYYQSSWYRYDEVYDNPYVYDLNNNKNITFDNTAYPYQTSNIVTFNQSKSTIVIFGSKYVDANNSVTSLNYSIGNKRLYNLKIYSNYTTLVRDFYPCYKKSDRTPGLFDAVTGVFYTNAISGGIFPVGSDIEISG